MDSPNDHCFSSNEFDDDISRPSPKRRRRLNASETKLLCDIFIYNQKPNASVRADLGHKLNMTPRAVQIWFQNKRAKLKKDPDNMNSPENGYQFPIQTPAYALQHNEPSSVKYTNQFLGSSSYLTPLATPGGSTVKEPSPRNLPTLDFGQPWVSPSYEQQSNYVQFQNNNRANNERYSSQRPNFEFKPKNWSEDVPVGPLSYVGSRTEIIKSKAKLSNLQTQNLQQSYKPSSVDQEFELSTNNSNEEAGTSAVEDSKSGLKLPSVSDLTQDLNSSVDVYSGHVYYSSIMDNRNHQSNNNEIDSKMDPDCSYLFQSPQQQMNTMPIDTRLISRISTPDFISHSPKSADSPRDFFNVYDSSTMFMRDSPYRMHNLSIANPSQYHMNENMFEGRDF